MIIRWSDKHSVGPPGETKTGFDSSESELLVYKPSPMFNAIRWGKGEMWLREGPEAMNDGGNYFHGHNLNCPHSTRPSGFVLTITQD